MRSQRVTLSILAVLFVAAAAHGEPSRGPGVEFTPFFQHPDERMQEWRDGLLNFLAKRPYLASEQVEAIQRLADLDLEFFAPILDAERKDLFAEHLGELGRVLSYWDYLRVLRSFDENVQLWLVDNGLAKLADLPTCNCNNRWDCANANSCESKTCIHDGSTTHDGLCAGSSTLENIE